MRKLVLVAVIAIVAVSVSAQKFGVKAGLGFAGYYGDNAKDLDSRLGFTLGGLYEIPLSTTGVYLQPEALITLKGAKMSESGYESNLSPFYLEVPVRALYKLNAGAGKVTFAAGPYVALGLFGKGSEKYEGESTSYNLFTKEDGASEAEMRRLDFGFSGAVGYELPSGLFVNLESSTGLVDIAKDAKMKNTVLALVVGKKF